jgi:hypothetical protein
LPERVWVFLYKCKLTRPGAALSSLGYTPVRDQSTDSIILISPEWGER